MELTWKLASAGAIAVLAGAAASLHAERLPLRAYGPADGLRSSVVLSVSTDSHGFIWVGTRDGLSRFDGRQFVHYGADQGLPVPTVNHVIESPGRGHWVATNGAGVCWLDAARPRSAADGSPLLQCRAVGGQVPSNRVNVLLEHQGRILAGSDAGLYAAGTAIDERFVPIPLEIPERPGVRIVVYSLAQGADDGSVWIAGHVEGGDPALFRLLPGGQVRHYVIPWMRERFGVRVLTDASGFVWIGQGRHLLRWRPAPATGADNARVSARLPSAPVLDVGAVITTLARGGDGLAWVGTLEGLVRADGTRVRKYTRANGLTDEVITALAADRFGDLWIATRAGGVLRLARDGLVTYDDADGLSAPDVHALFTDRAGRLHAVTGNWMLSRFSGARFLTQPGRPPGRTSEYDSDFAFLDRDGHWWVTSSEGLARYASASGWPGAARPVALSGDRLTGSVFRFFEDRAGGLWLSSKYPPALFRREPATGRLRAISDLDRFPLPGQRATAFCDSDGGVWIGFMERGLLRYADGAFTVVADAPEAITALYCDDAHRVWIASSQSGVAVIDDARSPLPRITRRYTSTDGLSSDNARALVADRFGNLFIGTAAGVTRLEPASGRMRHFRASDGLASDHVTRAARDGDGDLWFGTRGWLSRYVPHEIEAPPPVPRVRITGVRATGVLHSLSHLGQDRVEGLRLDAGTAELQIEFSSVGASAGVPLRYQYRLASGREAWSEPTSEQIVHYARPAPGDYTFEVRAVTSDGRVSAVPASVTFEVEPAFWQRRPVQGLTVIAGGLLILMGHRYRVAHLVAMERLRTRIAADLHDEIGSSLTRMAVLSEVARQPALPRAEGSRRIEEIGRTARSLIGTLGDIVWAVNPQRDDLGSLVRRLREYAGDVLEDIGIRFECEVPDGLDRVRLAPEPRQQIFLILKEALHNVARHSAASAASLVVELPDDGLRVTVRDNGCGLPVALSRAGHGLSNMRTRAQRIGGRLDISTGPDGRGTSIRLTVRLSRGRMGVLWRSSAG